MSLRPYKLAAKAITAVALSVYTYGLTFIIDAARGKLGTSAELQKATTTPIDSEQQAVES